MSPDLPQHPSLEHLRKQAKELLRAARAGDADALGRLRSLAARPAGATLALADAQHAVAREYGFATWAALAAHVESAAPARSPAEALGAAVRADDAARVAAVLARYPALRAALDDPLPGLDFGATALLGAVARGNREMVDVLLAAGADIDARSHWWAGGFGVLDNDGDLHDFLIGRGATVDAYAAARLGMRDRLAALVAADPACVRMRGGDGQTPLHVARDPETAAFLLDHGAEIDALDVDHEATPAQYAARDRQDVARLLVARGCRTDILLAAALGDVALVRRHLDADPESVRTTVSERYFPRRNPHMGGHIYVYVFGHNRTPHHVARTFGHDEVLRLLMERSPADVRLAQACELGDDATVAALLAEQPDLVRHLPADARRRLPDAAQAENAAAVRRMLAAGWPVDARGQHGATALHWAAWHGDVALVRDILAHRPPLELTDLAYGTPPIHWAVFGSVRGWHPDRGDYPGVVAALLDAGAKPPALSNGLEPSAAVRAVLRRT